MNVLHLMSCRGWSSDAYWAASVSAALERAGHVSTLVCKRGSAARVIDRARAAGAGRVETLRFASGVRPASDAADLRRLVDWLPSADVVHVHRGKEHWLAALANRLGKTPRPIVRTRHISLVVRAHALNRWLYAQATDLVVTVTEAIRRQYVAAGLIGADRVVALPGGVSLEHFHPGVDGAASRRRFGVGSGVPLIGVVAGLRVMKGHRVLLAAVKQLDAEARRPFHVVCIGGGSMEAEVRRWIHEAGLQHRVTLAGFVPDLPAAIAALDVAVYPVLESEGMSRVVFEHLAMGKPLVATRVGVVPDVLEDGATGLLVPAGEAAPLASALRRMLDDAPLRAKLGDAAAAIARERFSSDRVARALADLYGRVARTERAGRST